MVDQYKCRETAAKEPVSFATAAATWSGIIIIKLQTQVYYVIN